MAIFEIFSFIIFIIEKLSIFLSKTFCIEFLSLAGTRYPSVYKPIGFQPQIRLLWDKFTLEPIKKGDVFFNFKFPEISHFSGIFPLQNFAQIEAHNHFFKPVEAFLRFP